MFSRTNIGGVYLEKGEFDKALNNFKIALDIVKKLKIPRTEADYLQNIGGVFIEKKEWKSALKEYFKALDIYLKLNDEGNKKKIIKNIRLILKQYKIGRNDLCPCDSGLKFKKCHGNLFLKMN